MFEALSFELCDLSSFTCSLRDLFSATAEAIDLIFWSTPPINTSVSVAPVCSLATSTASNVSLINFETCSLVLFSVSTLTKTLSPAISTLTSLEETLFIISFANSFASKFSFELLFVLSPSVISDFKSKFFCSASDVCCFILLTTDGAGEGLKFKDRTVVPFGCSTTGITF